MCVCYFIVICVNVLAMLYVCMFYVIRVYVLSVFCVYLFLLCFMCVYVLAMLYMCKTMHWFIHIRFSVKKNHLLGQQSSVRAIAFSWLPNTPIKAPFSNHKHIRRMAKANIFV